VDHITVRRWVRRFTPLLADAVRFARHRVGDRWHVDETYLKVAGRWVYLYWAVDQFGQVIDVYASNPPGRGSRHLPWEAEFDPRRFWFTSFGYFGDEDNRRILAEVHKVLRPSAGW
jgi:hypothetical protein